MKLILTQSDLEEALRRYVGGMLTLAEGTKMDIEFKATRGENGMSAEVDINYLNVNRIAGIADTARDKMPEEIEEVGRGRQETPVTNIPPAAPVKKIDGRSAEARAAKKSNLFGDAPPTTKTPEVLDTVDRAVAAFTQDPPVATPVLDAAEEVLSEGDEAPDATEVLAAPEPVEETPKPRKSLFS